MSLGFINHDKICKDYENNKYKNFNFNEFENTFNNNNTQKKNPYLIRDYLSSKETLENRFKSFKLTKGRKPIFIYNKELIERRTALYNKNFNDEKFKNKMTKIQKLIEKTIKFFENMLIAYTEPIQNYEFELNQKNFLMYKFDGLFKGGEKIFLKKFDYYLFIDFEYNKDDSYTAYNLPQFSNLVYNSRPIIGYIRINNYFLSDGEVKFDEVMTTVHEILHSFGLVNPKVVDPTMQKIIKMNENNKIKQYIKKHNDFYKLYMHLYKNNIVTKLYNGTGHFNPDYINNEVMQPEKVYIKHFTYFTAGLFEIIVDYEMRFNRKLLRRNYETCLPILKELFTDKCDHSSGNFIKSFSFNDQIRLNNKCIKNKLNNQLADSFCDSSFQYKRYCNYGGGIKNKFCYTPVFAKNSNCFDHANNFLNVKSFGHQEFVKEFYGKTSNCFEIKGSYTVTPVCLKNEIDFTNSKIIIFFNSENGNKEQVFCKYKKDYDSKIKEFVFTKIDQKINMNVNGKKFVLNCPDMNRFYKNNISNLCPNDCFMNGRCIDINKCECFKGYDSNTNCKNLKPGYSIDKNSRTDYTFKERSSGANNGGYTNRPGANNGGYTNRPGANNGGYTNRPGANNGGYTNRPGANNRGYTNRPGANNGGYTNRLGTNNGGYTNRPGTSNGGYTNRPGANNGGYTNRPGANNGGYINRPNTYYRPRNNNGSRYSNYNYRPKRGSNHSRSSYNRSSFNRSSYRKSNKYGKKFYN